MKKVKKNPNPQTKKKQVLPRSIELYMPLVHSIASMVSGKGLPPNIEYDDLVSDGTIGLMKAWDNFDPKRGVKFETYASYRVRGEILDGLRNYSPVPYRVQVMIRDLAKKGYKASVAEKISKKEEELEKKSLSEKDFESAIKKVKKIVSASALMYLLSLEEIVAFKDIQVAGEKGPMEEVEFSELQEKLNSCIDKLPPIQRQVMILFYRKGLNQKTIAVQLKLSRPKVCRLIDKGIKILQKELKHV